MPTQFHVLRDFSGGLNTEVDPSRLPENYAVQADNLTVERGLIQSISLLRRDTGRESWHVDLVPLPDGTNLFRNTPTSWFQWGEFIILSDTLTEGMPKILKRETPSSAYTQEVDLGIPIGPPFLPTLEVEETFSARFSNAVQSRAKSFRGSLIGYRAQTWVKTIKIGSRFTLADLQPGELLVGVYQRGGESRYMIFSIMEAPSDAYLDENIYYATVKASYMHYEDIVDAASGTYVDPNYGTFIRANEVPTDVLVFGRTIGWSEYEYRIQQWIMSENSPSGHMVWVVEDFSSPESIFSGTMIGVTDIVDAETDTGPDWLLDFNNLTGQSAPPPHTIIVSAWGDSIYDYSPIGIVHARNSLYNEQIDPGVYAYAVTLVDSLGRESAPFMIENMDNGVAKISLTVRSEVELRRYSYMLYADPEWDSDYRNIVAWGREESYRTQEEAMAALGSTYRGQYRITRIDLGAQATEYSFARRIRVSGIPNPAEGEKYNIYRTRADSQAGPFYFLRTVRSSAPFIDMTTGFDLSVVQCPTLDNLPPVYTPGSKTASSNLVQRGVRMLTMHQGTCFGITGNRVHFTKPGAPWYWPALNYFEFPGPVQAIVSAAGELLILLEREVHRLVGFTQAEFALVKVPTEQGCSNPLTVKVLNGTPMWVGPDGLCAWNGGTVEVLTLGRLSRSYLDGTNYAMSGGSQYVAVDRPEGSYGFRVTRFLFRGGDMRITHATAQEISPQTTEGGYYDETLKTFYVAVNGSTMLALDFETPKSGWDQVAVYLDPTKYTTPQLDDGAAGVMKRYRRVWLYGHGTWSLKVAINGEVLDGWEITMDTALSTEDTRVTQYLPAGTRGMDIQLILEGVGTIKEMMYEFEQLSPA